MSPLDGDPVLGAALRPLFALEAGTRHLNHGSFGATPLTLLDEQARWRARMEANPTRFMARELPGLLREAAAALADLLGTSPERLAFVENATGGINAILRSLDIAPGSDLLTTDHVYPAVANTLRHVARKAGASLIEAPLPLPVADDAAILGAIEAAFTPRTRLVVVDHIASASAIRFPVAEIAALCRARGALVIVDGAHAPGMAELDIDAIGADWYVGNCHKWLCAPKGAGFVVQAGRPLPAIHPPIISNAHGAGFPLEFDYVGTRDYSPWLTVPAAIAFHDKLGGARLRARNRSLARQVGDSLAGLGELAAAPGLFEAMTAVLMPTARPATRDDAHRLSARLARDHAVEAPFTALGGRLLLRLSCFTYNELNEYEGLADKVRETLRSEGCFVTAET